MKLSTKILILLLFAIPFSAQAQYLGQRMAENLLIPCKQEQLSCLIIIPDVNGTYTINKNESDLIKIEGALIWSNTADPEALAMVSGLELELLFLSNSIVVHQETIKTPGKANKPVLFSHIFKLNKAFDATAFVEYKFNGPK